MSCSSCCRRKTQSRPSKRLADMGPWKGPMPPTMVRAGQSPATPHATRVGLRLAELLAPLAAAADAGAALPPETAQRTALIAVALARALGFPPATQSDLLYAGLVRHLGCSATAHEETRLMGDEQELRRAMSTVDTASP